MGRALWLEGEPGIGKTVLIDELLVRAAAAPVTILRGAAEELAQPFPLRVMAHSLGVAADAADPLRAEISGLITGGRDVGVLDPVLAASERMLELVDRLCATAPVLLVLEDLHWSDGPSLAVWERLASAVDQMPLLLVGTSHPVAHRPEVERLRAASTVLLRPGPLSPQRVAELAARLTDGTASPELISSLESAGGNPMYLRELIRAWPGPGAGGATDAADAADRADRVGDIAPPQSLTAAIGRRLDSLTPETHDVLRLAAMLGKEFGVRQLALLTERPLTGLLVALEEAVAAGALAEVDDRLIFRHELVRQVLRGETAGPLRAALHMQFAHVLALSGADIDAVGGHLMAGSGTIERWAAQWLTELPDTALYAVPEVAAELLSRAVRAPGAVGESWGVLAGRLATVCFTLGRDTQAAETAAEVVATVSDPELLGRMQLVRVRVASRQARSELALTVASAAMRDERLPAIWRTRIRARAAVVLVKNGRFDEGGDEARQALVEATRIADPVAAGHARLVLAHLSGSEEGLEQIEAALVGLGADPDAMDLRLILLNNKLALLNNLGRRAEFQSATSQVLIMAGRAGVPRTGRLLSPAAMGAFDFGAWDEALLHLESIPVPQSGAVEMSRLGVSALIAGHREDWPRLREQVALGAQIPITAGDVRIISGYLTAARAIRAEADGDHGRAVAELSCWLDPDLQYDAKERYMWLPDLVRLALTVGDADTAQAATRAAESDAAGADPVLRQLAAADFCRAQLADDVPTLLQVAQTGQSHGWVLMQASAQEEAAVRLAAADDITLARSTLNDAARGYAALGATWDLRRADARLRAFGVRRGPRSLHRRPANGWQALTPTEQRVATLVAQGRSNPDIAAELFISRRTAQTHVSRILHKLDLQSRMDVIRAANLA